ncbi:MAG: zf-HC2 domain-containing protein [Steroidobacteraceae bacterium]
MDHLRFKSEQTAAAYVAGDLDPRSMEQFELHMMSCPECVEAVEGWRAIKSQLGRGAFETRASPAPPADEALAPVRRPARLPSETRRGPARPTHAALRWRLASMITLGLLAGAAGGWYLRTAEGPPLDGGSIGFYDLPPVTRGPANCVAVDLGPRVSLIALRVPGALASEQLVAVGGNGRDLPPEAYSVRTQSDGSWLIRLEAATVRAHPIRLEARSADGTVDPRGCIAGTPGG